MNLEKFSERLKSLMLPGETRAEFAARIGVSQPTLHRYLTGRSWPRPVVLKRLSAISGKSVDWFLYGDRENARLLGASQKQKFKDAELAEMAAQWIKQAKNLEHQEKELLGHMLRDMMTNAEMRQELLRYYDFMQVKHGKKPKLDK